MAMPPQFKKKGDPGTPGADALPPSFAKKGKKKMRKSAPAQKALRMGGSARFGGAR